MILLMKNSRLAYELEMSLLSKEPRKKKWLGEKTNFLVPKKKISVLMLLQFHAQAVGQEDPLGKGLATHSSVPAWRIPRTEEPGGLHSMGSQRVRHE